MAKKRSDNSGRFSGMIENPHADGGKGLRLYFNKIKEENKAAGIKKTVNRVQYSPLKRYGRKTTRDMHALLRVRKGETHEEWLKRTAKYRIPTVEDITRTKKGTKIYKVYSSTMKKENVKKQKEVFDERFNERPKLFTQYLWALFGYFEVKYGLERNHFQFILYLDSLERPFSKEEFFAKSMAFGIKYGSFKAWMENHIIVDIGHKDGQKTETGMYRLYHDISHICYLFYNYVSGDKMPPQLKIDHEKKTSVNTMLLELQQEMVPYMEGTKPQVLTIRVDEDGNIIK